MSYEIATVGDLTVSRHVGPADEGEDRRRWQFSSPTHSGLSILTAAQLEALLNAIIEDYRVPPHLRQLNRRAS
jgi:hypothetical protein